MPSVFGYIKSIGSPTAMLVYKIMNQNIQILNKTVPIAITLHVYVLIAGDERRQSLHSNQLVSIVINSYNWGWKRNIEY